MFELAESGIAFALSIASLLDAPVPALDVLNLHPRFLPFLLESDLGLFEGALFGFQLLLLGNQHGFVGLALLSKGGFGFRDGLVSLP